jgi:hypothetical protein
MKDKRYHVWVQRDGMTSPSWVCSVDEKALADRIVKHQLSTLNEFIANGKLWKSWYNEEGPQR